MEHEGVLTSKWTQLTDQQKVFFTQAGILAGIQIADALTTSVGIQLGHAEANILFEQFVEDHGLMAIALIKSTIAAGQLSLAGLSYATQDYEHGVSLETTNSILRLWNTYSICIPFLNSVMLLQQ